MEKRASPDDFLLPNRDEVTAKIPIAFFVFRRPRETSLVFEAIRNYKPSRLLVVADGARDDRPGETAAVLQVREIVSKIDWVCEVVYDFSPVNLGLRERILTGIDKAFDHFEECVILEDDCLPHPGFFEFCRAGIEVYSSDSAFGMMSGFNSAPSRKEGAQAMGTRSPMIWGWATTRSVWRRFRASPQVESWSQRDFDSVRISFAFKPASRSLLRMMSAAESLNTWDVSVAVWFRLNALRAIVPPVNLVQNIGFGAGATHTNFESFTASVVLGELPNNLVFPDPLPLDDGHERRVWLRSIRLWASFPVLHPISFLRRAVTFAMRTEGFAGLVNQILKLRRTK